MIESWDLHLRGGELVINVANRYEVIGAMLAARGHSDARIAKVLGGNVARVMREVWG